MAPTYKTVTIPYLPPKIKKSLDGKSVIPVQLGHSNASVYQVKASGTEWYLKIERQNEAFTREQQIMAWLKGKLPVPDIIMRCEENGYDFLLMTKAPGEMACSDRMLKEPQQMVQALADGIKRLHQVNISDCPYHFSLDTKLKLAYERILRGEVSMKDWELDNDFASPEALYAYLAANKPVEAPVFTHGDYCLPNIFITGNRATGYIDLGRAGVADMWQDIALCIRSLTHNLNTTAYHQLFFEVLGVVPDDEKIKYYILLDELF